MATDRPTVRLARVLTELHSALSLTFAATKKSVNPGVICELIREMLVDLMRLTSE